MTGDWGWERRKGTGMEYKYKAVSEQHTERC